MIPRNVRSYATRQAAVIAALGILGVYTLANGWSAYGGGHELPDWIHGAALVAAGLALAGALAVGGGPTSAAASRGARSPAAEAGQGTADYLETVRLLAAALDTGDPFALGRSYRVAQFCLKVGIQLGLSADRLCALEIAALLHDIGRAAIHRDVLLKPGRLDVAERETVRTHPGVGYDILRGVEPLRLAAEIVHAHHEQPDGRGYPRGLSGDAIPIESSIISAVAAFDAMTCDRPYRRALSAAEAVHELREFAGCQFRPDVVEALATLHATGGLYAGLDLVSLERYSSGRCVSRAVEEHLSRNQIPWGGPARIGGAAAVPGGAATSRDAVPYRDAGGASGDTADIEIDLVSDGQLFLAPCESDRSAPTSRASGD